MTINTHAVKTILLAVIAAGSFVAAVVVGMGLGSKKADYRQSVSCETTTVAAANPRRAYASC
jgi:hypothetical protein